MYERILILSEVFTMISCIHRLYNRKLNFNIAAFVLVLSCAIAYDVTRACGIVFLYNVMVYVFIILYCIWRYDDSIAGAVFNTFLMIFIIAVMQFFFILFIELCLHLSESGRALLSNAAVLVSCNVFISRYKIYRLRTYVKRWTAFLLGLAVIPLCMIIFIRIQQSTLGEIQVHLFIFAMPMLAMCLWLMGKWLKEQKEKLDVEKKLQITEKMQEQYDELIKAVRLRQHEYRNHLAAILATRYTYKSYDKLVKAQEKYCGQLIQENRHNDLLLLGDRVLVGFLYEKFCEFEANNVGVRYTIKGRYENALLPIQHLIEMTGILLDNAFQAVRGRELDGFIQFDFSEDREDYQFKVSNPFPYTSYSEIEIWFQMGKSTKGKGHGLGLYRIRCLCKEENCDIMCRNVEIEEKNWIEFILKIRKADRK